MGNTPENNKGSEGPGKRSTRKKIRKIRLPSDHPIYFQGWTVGFAPVIRTSPPSAPTETDGKTEKKNR